jgi:transcription termination factor Rho
VEGALFVTKEGFGFLRQRKNSYLSGSGDPFVPAGLIQRHRLRPGQYIEGRLGRSKRGRRKRPLEVVELVDGDPPKAASQRPRFRNLTSINPDRRIFLETRDSDPNMRVIDLVTPIGFGQRFLVVAPPRTGKTVILHKLANSIAENHPEAKVIVLLVDERPEEVTDFRRSCKNAEVIASSLDMDASAHVNISEMVLERVRRLAEKGEDVICLMDSLTRMARAFNTERGRSGRTLTGGLDSTAMQKPREFFGAARCFEQGGSITNIATVLVDTGSKMDQVIFEEFKGTGNAELVLSRDLADFRIFPAINIKDSGTRREERLRDPQEHQLVNMMRRALMRFGTQRAMETLMERVNSTSSNGELLMMLQKQMI